MGSDGSSSITDTRRTRERRERLERIRAAAIQEFARRGYAATTMAQVARRAELGKATLYYYFATKQELFGHIVEQAAIELAQGVEAAVPPDAGGLDAAEAACRYALAFFRRHEAALALFLPLIAGGPERLRELLGEEVTLRVTQAHAPLFRHLERVAPALPGQAEAPAETAVHMVGSLLLGLATKVLHGAEESLDAELDLFLGLLRGARRGGADPGGEGGA
jgi:AcrR family transcriptional regulator